MHLKIVVYIIGITSPAACRTESALANPDCKTKSLVSSRSAARPYDALQPTTPEAIFAYTLYTSITRSETPATSVAPSSNLHAAM